MTVCDRRKDVAHQNARRLEPCNSWAIGGSAVARIVASIEERRAQTQSVTKAIQNRHDFLVFGGLVTTCMAAPFGDVSLGTVIILLEDSIFAAWISGSSILETTSGAP